MMCCNIRRPVHTNPQSRMVRYIVFRRNSLTRCYRKHQQNIYLLSHSVGKCIWLNQNKQHPNDQPNTPLNQSQLSNKTRIKINKVKIITHIFSQPILDE